MTANQRAWLGFATAALLAVGVIGCMWLSWQHDASDYRAKHNCLYLFGQWFATEQLTDKRFCQ